jgi:hypothetical protein
MSGLSSTTEPIFAGTMSTEAACAGSPGEPRQSCPRTPWSLFDGPHDLLAPILILHLTANSPESHHSRPNLAAIATDRRGAKDSASTWVGVRKLLPELRRSTPWSFPALPGWIVDRTCWEFLAALVPPSRLRHSFATNTLRYKYLGYGYFIKFAVAPYHVGASELEARALVHWVWASPTKFRREPRAVPPSGAQGWQDNQEPSISWWMDEISSRRAIRSGPYIGSSGWDALGFIKSKP